MTGRFPTAMRGWQRALAMVYALGTLGVLAGCATGGSVALDATGRGGEVVAAPRPAQVSRGRTAAVATRGRRLALDAGSRADTDLIARHVADTEQSLGAPITAGNRIRLLVDGPQTHAAMFAAIAGARRTIDLESYIIEDDEVGARLAEALIAKAREGLVVSVLFDSVGSVGTPTAYFERLRDAGVRVCEFNPVSPWKARRSWALNQRDHRKLLVVDGQTGFAGGINFSSVYASGSSGGRRTGEDAGRGWRDTHAEVRGPAVGEMTRLFDLTWVSQRCSGALPMRTTAAVAIGGGRAAQVIGSGPSSGPNRMYLAFLSAMRHAERSIYLTQAYFVPDQRTLDALIDAAERGVDVRLVLPSISDFWAPLAAGRSHYETLLAHGVRIYERQETLLHAKTAVIDGVWSTIGSANLDWRSFSLNEEANVVVFDDEFGRQMIELFDADLSRSREISLAAWEARDALERLREWLARRFEHLL